jgi:hypothetical protein
MSRNEIVATGVGWYTPDQYSLLRAYASDSDNVAQSYEEWLAHAERLFREISVRQIRPVKVSV